MAFIETIFGLAILVLIGKAVIETIRGLCYMALGIFWHTVALTLNALAVMINTYERLTSHGKG